jgi:hypothetical protein
MQVKIRTLDGFDISNVCIGGLDVSLLKKYNYLCYCRFTRAKIVEVLKFGTFFFG